MIDHHLFQHGIRVIKENGIRMTPQRLAILQYMATTEAHPTVDEIYKDLQKLFPSITTATIYNNLKCFKKYDLINELSFGEAASRFEWATSFHYHIKCTACGKIANFYYPKLMEIEELASEKSGYKVNHHFFELSGICPDCK